MSTLARWRTGARLAVRQLRRAPLAAALISALILLPVAGLTAFAIVGSSMIPHPEEKATVELGKMQAWVEVKGAPDPSFVQSPTDPDGSGTWSGEDSGSSTPPLVDPMTALPAGTESVRVVESTVRVRTPEGIADVSAWSGESWDARFAGRFDRVTGRTPTGGQQAMVTPAALDRLHIAIGDTIVLPDTGASYTVVGTLAAASLAADAPAVFLPADADLPGRARWYLPSLSLHWDEIRALNTQGIVAYSRGVALEPPPTGHDTPWALPTAETGEEARLALELAATGGFSAYVLLMLTGAAFAVTARRQQRTLAVAASVGASPADLHRIVLFQGTSLGILGGSTGLALGTASAAVVMTVTDDGSATRYWGFHAPWPALAVILLLTVVVATASAALPARAAARTDVVATLRGAGRGQRPMKSHPIWAWILLLTGGVLSIGAVVALRSATLAGVWWDQPIRLLLTGSLVIGPLLIQLGFVLMGGRLLALLSRGFARIGTTARLAARDAAANASRTLPAVAAIAATLFIAIFALGQLSMQTADVVRTWGYTAPQGSLDLALVPTSGRPITVDAADGARDAAQRIARSADAADSAVISEQTMYWPQTDRAQIPVDTSVVIALIPTQELRSPDPAAPAIRGLQNRSNPISVIASDDIDTALGIHLSDEQRDAYRRGAAIVTDPRFVTDGTITLGAWSATDAADGRIPDNYSADPPPDLPRTDPLWEKTVTAVTVDAPRQRVAIAVSPESAARLGITSKPSHVIVSFDGTADDGTRDRVAQQAQVLSGPLWTIDPTFEDGPPDHVFWVVPVIAAVAVLVLGVSGIALGLARVERRPDDATLSAVGAGQGTRRRISMWQGLLVSGLGTIIGTAAGVLPPIGFGAESGSSLSVSNIPWALFVGLAVALPLLVAFVSWLIPPRRTESARRTAIA